MLLWPFNKYPGTDYETFNWEWILKTVKDYTKKVDDFIADITETWNAFRAWTTGEIDQMHDDFANYVNVTEEALNTGAIADGAITAPKINASFLKLITNYYVTPEMYGAAGDGVTNDTQAVQAALDSGIELVLLPNKYLCDGLQVPSNTKIIGGEIVVSDETIFNVIDKSNVRFENIKFTGTYTGGNMSNGSCINIEESNNVMVEKCCFQNIGLYYCVKANKSEYIKMNKNAINIYGYTALAAGEGSSNVEISDNIIKDGRGNISNNRYGIQLSGGQVWTSDLQQPKNLYCIGNYLEDVTPIWEAIDAHCGENVWILDNIIKNFISGIVVTNWTTIQQGVTPPKSENVYIENNVIEGAETSRQYGIVVQSDSNNVGKNAKIINNRISKLGKASAGVASSIYTSYMDGVDINGNKINDIGGRAITLSTPALKNVNINGNSIQDVTPTGNQRSVAIYFYGMVTGPVTIEDNTLGLDTDTTILGCAIEGPTSTAYTGTSKRPIVVKNNKTCATYEALNRLLMLFDKRDATPGSNTYAGEPGDIVFNSGVTATSPIGWICTASGDPTSQTYGTWREINTN